MACQRIFAQDSESSLYEHGGVATTAVIGEDDHALLLVPANKKQDYRRRQLIDSLLWLVKIITLSLCSLANRKKVYKDN